MQVAAGPRLAVVLLLALAAGCREEPKQQSEVFEPVTAVPEAASTAVPERVEAEEEAQQFKPVPPQPPTGSAADIAAGITRDRLMELMGDCAHRVSFARADGNGGKTVEIFQPKSGACADRFEPRRFFVVGGVLESIQPGMDLAVETVAAAPIGEEGKVPTFHLEPGQKPSPEAKQER